MQWLCSVVKTGTAAFLAGLVLACGLLSVSPGLHEALHVDADQEGHHCAITFFAQGQIEGPGPELRWVPLLTALTRAILFIPDTLPSEPDFLLLPSCGPPTLPA